MTNLKDRNVNERFQIELRNRFQALEQSESADLEDRWKLFRDTVVESPDVAIGRRKGTYKERWIQDETCGLIDERRHAKQ